MKIHVLKSWIPYFEQVANGEKLFEIRKNDRGYAVGDALVLRRYNPLLSEYRSGWLAVIVTSMVSAEDCPWPFLQPGVVVMGIRETSYVERVNVLRKLKEQQPDWNRP